MIDATNDLDLATSDGNLLLDLLVLNFIATKVNMLVLSQVEGLAHMSL